MNSLLRQIFDICVDSEVPLPVLPLSQKRASVWTIRCFSPGAVKSDLEWFHTWRSTGGEPLMKVARDGGDYLLRIFDLASFRIRFGRRRIEVFPEDRCGEETLAHLLVDQVLPRVLCHQGRTVLHASAVALRDGRVFAFTGVSGRGKSTLAAAFHNAGHRVLADDCLMLERREHSTGVLPPYSSLRLWLDSLDAFAGTELAQRGQISDMAQYSGKKQVTFKADSGTANSGPVALDALFLLEEPRESAVEAAAAGGQTAIMTLIEAQFALDVRDRDIVQRDFRSMGDLAAVLPVYSLAYPRRFDSLPEVLDSIMSIY